ncbi:hypothetical protein [Halomonas sp. SL1]|nr:hypothetical protein [Halomonas sp. SL1]
MKPALALRERALVEPAPEQGQVPEQALVPLARPVLVQARPLVALPPAAWPRQPGSPPPPSPV